MNSFTGSAFGQQNSSNPFVVDGDVKILANTTAGAIVDDGDVRVRKRLRTESISLSLSEQDGAAHLDVQHSVLPANHNPTAFAVRVFAKSDNKLYTRTSAGAELAVGGIPIETPASTPPNGTIWYDPTANKLRTTVNNTQYNISTTRVPGPPV